MEKPLKKNAHLLKAAALLVVFTSGCTSITEDGRMQPGLLNELTEAEKSDGWRLLWDGRTLDGWVGVRQDFKRPPAKGWVVSDGVLTVLPSMYFTPDRKKLLPLPPEKRSLGGGGDIVTKGRYGDFAFKFEFRLTEAANSGIKYFYDEKQNSGTCEEYQILDPAHPDATRGRDGNRRVAALYDIFPSRADAILKKTGEWNEGMVVSRGTKVEHWLNGVRVLVYDRSSEAFRNGVAKSKYAPLGLSAAGARQPWGMVEKGRILLQDHADSTVSYRNLKIKEF